MSFIFLWTIIPALLWGHISASFFTLPYLLLFAGIIFCAVAFNNLYFYSISNENVCDLEPIAILSLPFTALLGSIFFPSERSFWIIVLTFISLFALIFSRFKKHHLRPNKYTLAMLGFVLFISVESILIKNLFVVINPIALYSIRTFFLASIFLIFFRPKKVRPKIDKRGSLHLVFLGLIIATEYFSRYLAYSQIGVVRSALLLLLGPILILVLSVLFLKEKITVRRAIGDIIVVLCVGASIFLG